MPSSKHPGTGHHGTGKEHKTSPGSHHGHNHTAGGDGWFAKNSTAIYGGIGGLIALIIAVVIIYCFCCSDGSSSSHKGGGKKSKRSTRGKSTKSARKSGKGKSKSSKKKSSRK